MAGGRLTPPGVAPVPTELPTIWSRRLDDYVVALSISHDGALGAVGTGAGKIYAFERATGSAKFEHEAHTLKEEAAQLVRDPGFRKLLTAMPGSAAQEALRAALTTAPRLAEDLASWMNVLAELIGSERIGVRLLA